MRMACRGCGCIVADFETSRGFQIHVGMCRGGGLPAAAQEAATERETEIASVASASPVAEVLGEGEGFFEENLGADDLMEQPERKKPSVFPCPTDEFLAEMYRKYPNMSRGMLNDCITLSKLGPSKLGSSKKLLEAIDKLPGSYQSC